MAMEIRPLAELLEGMVQEREELRARQADALRQAREAAGLSQANFASLAGVSQPYLSQVENGSRTISTDTLSEMHDKLAALPPGGTENATHEGTRTAKADAAKARGRKP